MSANPSHELFPENLIDDEQEVLRLDVSEEEIAAINRRAVGLFRVGKSGIHSRDRYHPPGMMKLWAGSTLLVHEGFDSIDSKILLNPITTLLSLEDHLASQGLPDEQRKRFLKYWHGFWQLDDPMHRKMKGRVNDRDGKLERAVILPVTIEP